MFESERKADVVLDKLREELPPEGWSLVEIEHDLDMSDSGFYFSPDHTLSVELKLVFNHGL